MRGKAVKNLKKITQFDENFPKGVFRNLKRNYTRLNKAQKKAFIEHMAGADIQEYIKEIREKQKKAMELK